MSTLAGQYWDRVHQGEFVVSKCIGCSDLWFYPRAICLSCGGATELGAVSGRAVVHSVITVDGGRDGGAHRHVALIDLVEGVRMLTNLTPAADGRVPGVDDEVVVSFVPSDAGLLPFFHAVTTS